MHKIPAPHRNMLQCWNEFAMIFLFFFFLKCETRCGRRKEESFGSSTYKTVSSIKNFVMSAKLFYHDFVFTPTLKGATKHIYGHRGERVEPKSWS